MFNDSRILITGGTGSWAHELTSQLLERYDVKEIVLFSRGELQQVLMRRRFNNPKLKFIIGDVRDYTALLLASENIDYVFHMAALKHVPVCEEFPVEAIKTNIDGTINIIKASIQNDVKKVIDLSTDKATHPINTYGMTKSVAEKLIIHANTLTDKTKFVCIRGGNVMGSNGSVIPFFIEQIKSKKNLTITDFRMTRYFLTLNEAIGLLFKAAEEGVGGEIFVMNMPACYIKDLAEVLIDHYNYRDNEISEIGIRPGEKLDEMLISEHESRSSYIYDNNYYFILPEIDIPNIKEVYRDFKKVPFNDFSSKTYIMNKPEIYTMLEKGGFLK